MLKGLISKFRDTSSFEATQELEALDVRDFPGRTLDTLVDGFGTGATKSLPVIRKWARRNPHLRRYQRLIRDNVLGTAGIQPQMPNAAMKKRWDKWTKTADLSRAGKLGILSVANSSGVD